MGKDCTEFYDCYISYPHVRIGLFRSWQPIKMAWTKSVVAFGKVADNTLIDAVPLDEVLTIHVMQDANVLSSVINTASELKTSPVDNAASAQQPKSAMSRIKSVARPTKPAATDLESSDLAKESSGKGSIMAPNTITIVTDHNGYNSGRKYYIQAQSDGDRRKIIATLSIKSKAAKKEKEAKGRMQRAKEKVAKLTRSKPFQYFFAILIVLVSPPCPRAQRSVRNL